MRKLGALIVLIGVGAWSFAGYAYFSSPSSTSSPVVQNISAAMESFHDSFLDPRASVASAAFAYMYDFDDEEYDFFGPSYYDEPDPYYYDDDFTYYEYSDSSYADAYMVVANPEPWYVQTFPGIGAIAQRIIPGQQRQQLATRSTVSPSVSPPTCSIIANPASIPYGGTTNLIWRSLDATRAVLDSGVDVPLSGTRALQGITSSEAFLLEVSGPGGETSCATTVHVDPLITKPPTCIIALQPTSISLGQSANLSWGSQNAASASLSSYGSVPLQGGTRVSPEDSTTYTLVVHSMSGKSVKCSTELSVN